ncbi:MAG: hypothetical protein AAF555_00160 [Verrucomicrobiota bacterium]
MVEPLPEIDSNKVADKVSRGCIFLLSVSAVIVGCLIYQLYHAFQFNGQIAQFTESSGENLQSTPLTAEQEGLLNEKLLAVEKATGELLLTVPEANHLFNRLPALKDFRGQMRIEAMQEGQLLVRTALPLNSLFLGERRYLNGVLSLVPALKSENLDLSVASIEVPGKEIPEQYPGQMSQYYFVPFLTEALKDVPEDHFLLRLKSIEVAHGEMRLQW